MANWIVATHDQWFADFVQMLRRELLPSEVLHADETTLMVLPEPERKAQQKNYVWVLPHLEGCQAPCGVV